MNDIHNVQSSITQNGFRGHANLTPISTLNINQNTLSNNQNNADLVLGVHQRHQRDLFSGSLGIPDVSTHVGSVVHAFETMAMKRHQYDQSEKPYETGSSSKSLKSSLETGFNKKHNNKIQLTKPPTSPTSTGLKKQSIKSSSRKIIQSLNDDEIFTNPSNENSSNNNSLILDNDYRKSLCNSSTTAKMDSKIFQENLNLHTSGYNTNLKSRKKSSKIVNQQQHIPHENTVSNINSNNKINKNNININSCSSSNNNHKNIINFDTNTCNPDQEDELFLRGTTVSQSFIKNVPSRLKNQKYLNEIGIKRERPVNKKPTNFIHTLSGKKQIYDVETRYFEYTGDEAASRTRSSKRKYQYKPRTLDRADL